MTAPKADQQPPNVSVVLTTHNEALAIQKTLDGLGRQVGFADGEFEVVLVDDRSTDGTIAAAKKADCKCLRVLQSKPDKKSELTTRQQALDLAFRSASGTVVLTLDANCLVADTWACDMSAPILNGFADAVAGPIGFAPTVGWISRWQNCDVGYYFLVCSVLGRLGYSSGVFFGNFAFRSSEYERLGGFDNIGFALTEDLAFAQTLHKGGARMAFQPLSIAKVAPCPDFTALIDRTMRISSGSFSVLALVLSLWQFSLMIAILGAVITLCPLSLGLLGLRYLVGIGVVYMGSARTRNGPFGFSFLLYELQVFVIAITAAWKMTRKKQVVWGGSGYGR